MSQPPDEGPRIVRVRRVFSKNLCEERLTEAASSLIQAAMLLREAGYHNESIAVAKLSSATSEHLKRVREDLMDGESDR